MSADVNKVLDMKDDFELCNELFKLMIKHYGEDFDVSKCKEKDQAVILVWHASGIIDNGGFQYLFEGNFKGDPYFARTAAAFKTIKASKCAEAIEEALKLFPYSKPPQDINKRLKIYQAVSAAKQEAIDVKFFSESKEMMTTLAKYIRENRAEFKHLK
ncbi:DUF4375 domain-containing protein [bacterium]|nr:DUF4375 domain-containing protein [bacterium]